MFRFAPRVHPPAVVTRWFPRAIWRVKTDEHAVFLTFDDGPVPGATPWVLDLLAQEQVKATFFCVGENVWRYPELYQEILAQGHSVGNHTYNHLQGVKTGNFDFYRNIAKAGRFISSDLLRPPHGLLTRQQYRFLSLRYQLVMWDIVARDFDPTLSPEKVVKNVMDFVRPGSVIVFHDSVKTINNLKVSLPLVIKLLKREGYSFRPIPYQANDVNLQLEGIFF